MRFFWARMPFYRMIFVGYSFQARIPFYRVSVGWMLFCDRKQVSLRHRINRVLWTKLLGPLLEQKQGKGGAAFHIISTFYSKMVFGSLLEFNRNMGLLFYRKPRLQNCFFHVFSLQNENLRRLNPETACCKIEVQLSIGPRFLEATLYRMKCWIKVVRNDEETSAL